MEVLSTSYSKPLSSQDSLSGIIATYICLFTKLGTTFIEANYSEIVKHLLTKLVPGQSFTPATPFEALAARQRCRRIFQDITQNILSATAINSHSVSDDFGSLIYTLSSEILNKNASSSR